MHHLVFVRYVIVGIICVTCIGAPVTSVTAQTANRSQQIEALSTTLSTIGEAIRTSSNITQAQRLAMYTQLVTISNSILLLGNSQQQTASTTINTTAKDIGLERVVLVYDYKQPTSVKATAHFASHSPRTFAFNYPKLLEYSAFTQRMAAVKQFGSYDVATQLDIAHNEVRGVTHITGNNPEKKGVFIVNSEQANRLVENFGAYSIISGLNIYPSKESVKIELFSDQQESMVIEIKRTENKESSRNNKEEQKFSYRQTFALFDSLNFTQSKLEDKDRGVVAVYTETDIKKDELLDLFRDLFGNQPFSKEIPNQQEKIFNFLLNNSSYVIVDQITQITPKQRECYDSADIVIANELAHSLIKTMEIQSKSLSDIFTVQAPVEVREGFFGSSTKCMSVISYF